MKTTKEIHQLYEMNNEAERNISLDKWYSEEEYNVLKMYAKGLEKKGYNINQWNGNRWEYIPKDKLLKTLNTKKRDLSTICLFIIVFLCVLALFVFGV